ncbi:MAG: hypothetical protein FWF77_08610 [Defluviitaleaceae bacterium]|nr:hypothetical protein [Defluviitaleaceae bacterium]
MTDLQKTHDTHNEQYLDAKSKMFEEARTDGLEKLASARLDKLLKEMSGIKIPAETNYVESLDLFVSFFDDVILECAELTDRREEIETKILTYCAKILPEEGERDAENEHVTAHIINRAKTHEEMKAAILHDTNPLRLGFFVFSEFCEKNEPNSEVLTYLQTEREVRVLLIKGDDAAAFSAVERLLQSPINSAEKYLLVSLNMFYLGLDDDARNALDIGLRNSPDNERLLSAKAALE